MADSPPPSDCVPLPTCSSGQEDAFEELELEDVSTASSPSDPDPRRLLRVPLLVGCASLDDALYASGFFHGVVSMELLPVLTHSRGDYFFALLLNRATDVGESLHMVVCVGVGDFRCVPFTVGAERLFLSPTEDPEEHLNSISGVVDYCRVRSKELFGCRNAMRRPLMRAWWQVHFECREPFIRTLEHSVCNCPKEFTVSSRCSVRRFPPADFQLHRKRLMNEVRMLSQLHHAHITNLVAFSCFTDIAVLTEYCPGDFRSLMAQTEVRAVSKVRVLYQLADALHYLKSRAVVHRHIEPDSILFDSHGNAKLADFSLAAVHSLNELPSNATCFRHRITLWLRSRPSNQELAETEMPMTNLPKSILTDMLVHCRYIAPETLTRHVFSCQTDLWQWALVAYELFSGKPPLHFYDGPVYSVQNLIQTADSWMKMPVTAPVPLRSLFLRCIARQGRERPSIEEVRSQLHDLLNAPLL